jgi:hypothetical protein
VNQVEMTGHDDLRTTQRYINEAQTFAAEAFDVSPSKRRARRRRFTRCSSR